MKKILFLFLIVLFSCKQENKEVSYLGIVNIEVSGNKEAVPQFEKGLLLLHSFEYADSRDAFLEAQKTDPEMLMSYWGEAMTYNHPLWSEQDFENGMEALKKLKNKQATAKVTELENDFIEGIHILYESDSSKVVRDKNYADFMSSLNKKYPDNHEVAAFYALSLLGSVPDGRDEKTYGKGADIANGILKENPKHPGALHYLIHSYDDPEHAKFALAAADSYSVVAPDASHALHMPSHIYINTGHYHEGSVANIRAVAVDSSYVTACHAQGVYPLAYYPHNYHFLVATATLEGDSRNAMMAAEKVSELINVVLMREPAWSTLQHFYIIPYHVAVKFGLWDEIMKMENDGAKLPYPESVRHYARGMAYLAQNDIKSAKQELCDLELVMKDPVIQELTIWEINPMSTLVEISREVLYGEILAMEGKYEESIAALEKAIQLEDGLYYNEPPDWFFSVRHHLGDVLVEAGRYQQAIEVYQQDLNTFPNNGWAYAGLYNAYIGSENYEEAGKAKMNYEEAFRHSDIDLAGSRILVNKEYISMR